MCMKRINGGVMVSVLVSSVVDRAGSNPGRVKPKIIRLVCVASPLNKQHFRVIAKIGWLGIRLIYRGGSRISNYGGRT